MENTIAYKLPKFYTVKRKPKEVPVKYIIRNP